MSGVSPSQPKSEREEWMQMIRDEYDPAPSHYKMGDDWDDGAGRIADAILADRLLLQRKHAEETERLRAKAAKHDKCASHVDCLSRDGMEP